MRDEYQLISGRRLPSGIIRHRVIEPGQTENTRNFFDVRIGLTWPGNNNPAYAWNAFFTDGGVGGNGKTGVYYARAVRAGSCN